MTARCGGEPTMTTPAEASGEHAADVPCGDIRALVLRLREIHHPGEVEVEVYHRDDEEPSSVPGPCPEPSPRYPSDPCPGHMETILFCVDCGVGDSGFGDLAFWRWPCRTIRALDKFEGVAELTRGADHDNPR